jgi:hypothetical protein
MTAKVLTLPQAFSSTAMFGKSFAGPSWDGWKAVLKASQGHKLTSAEDAFFRSVAERDPPTEPVRQMWIIAGRRAGKDSVTAAIATYKAAIFDGRNKVRPGERPLVLCLAVDRPQAGLVLNYIRAYFAEIPALKGMVTRETQDGLELNNGIDIQVYRNDFKSVRGRTLLCAIFDEVGFWQDDNSAAPDSETYAAVLPGLMTLKGTLIGISSPYRKAGLLYERWKKYYGQNDPNVLVVRAPSIVLNPTLSQFEIDEAIAENPQKFKAEYLAEWRSDLEGLFTAEAIEQCVIPGRHELGRAPNQQYFGFIDPSGGASDAMTMAIAHKDRDIAVLDLIRERKPPFNPSEVAAEFSAELKRYGISTARSDRYGAAWVSEQFTKNGITLRPSDQDKSAIYNNLVPIINSAKAELLDHPKLLAQLGQLEIRTARGGRTSIDHPEGSGFHDDIANACAGAIVFAVKRAPQSLKFVAPPICDGAGNWTQPAAQGAQPSGADLANQKRPPSSWIKGPEEPWRSFVDPGHPHRRWQPT